MPDKRTTTAPRPQTEAEAADDLLAAHPDPTVREKWAEIVRLRGRVEAKNTELASVRDTARRQKQREWDRAEAEYKKAVDAAWHARDRAYRQAEARAVGAVTPVQLERDTHQRSLEDAWAAFREAEREYMARLHAEATGTTTTQGEEEAQQ